MNKSGVVPPAPQERSALDVFAKIVRALTVPAVLVAVLLVVLYLLHKGVFYAPGELIAALAFLVIIPLLAYPLSYAAPSIRAKGREGQRKLAFVLNFVGYTGALIYGIVAETSKNLLLIFATYFISVLVLIVFNKLLKVRASGHACGVAGPLFFFVYFTGLPSLLPCIVVAAGVVWSSLRLKRHTIAELILGASISLVSLFIAYAILSFV